MRTLALVGYLTVAAAVLAAGVCSLFLRRYGERAAPAPRWQRTDELFRDPKSERLMRVWVDPADGSRHYVPDA